MGVFFSSMMLTSSHWQKDSEEDRFSYAYPCLSRCTTSHAAHSDHAASITCWWEFNHASAIPSAPIRVKAFAKSTFRVGFSQTVKSGRLWCLETLWSLWAFFMEKQIVSKDLAPTALEIWKHSRLCQIVKYPLELYTTEAKFVLAKTYLETWAFIWTSVLNPLFCFGFFSQSNYIFFFKFREHLTLKSIF